MQTGTHCLYDTSILCVCVCAEEKKEKTRPVFIQCVRSIIKYTRLWQSGNVRSCQQSLRSTLSRGGDSII